jgi:hypothetical protein
MSDTNIFDDNAGEDTQTPYEYDDPDELYRVRRIEQILDALETYDEGKAKLKYHPEARHKLTVDERDALRDELALTVVRHLEPIVSRTEYNLLGRQVVLHSDDGEMRRATLEQLLDSGGHIAEEYEEVESTRGTQPRERVTKVRYYTMEEATADKVVRMSVDFLESVMPVGLSDDTRTANADYSDIL